MTACRRPTRSRSSASRRTRAPEYDFSPLTEADLALVERWLREPHVRRWWDDDPTERYPDDDLAEYRKRIRGIGDPTDLFLIRLAGRPIGFIQSYRVDDHSDYARAIALDSPAAGIDLFIGEPELIGRGHGPKLLRVFLRDVLFPRYGVSECVIGPSVRNTSAIRAYEKAGFRLWRDAVVPGEADPERILRIARAEVS